MAEKIKLTGKVEVTGTGKSQFFPKGEKRKVHPALAKKLKKAGKVK